MTSIRCALILLVQCSLLVSIAAAQPPMRSNLMPMPAHLQLGEGELLITGSFSVVVSGHRDGRVERGVERFVSELSQQTGIPLQGGGASSARATLAVHAEHASGDVQSLGEDESYELTVTVEGATLSAATPLGILHGLQTFLQLVRSTPEGFAVPAISIADKPRFPWRGLLVDVSRHFIPLHVLKRNLDGMAAVKFNVLHLHLSDNEGFRVESRRFPKLHEMGSEGLYYTQAEIRELVAYARDRGVRIVPEFDMPGHTRSWYVGYPELASAPGPYNVERKALDSDPAMDPTREGTYKFLDKFIGEMAGLFPDSYFHVGGDEVNGKNWDEDPKIQQFIRSHGMQGNGDLQAYFNQRVQKLVSKHGKIMIGWDEVLHPVLPKSIVVQSWRGQDSLWTAAQQGYRGLLSFGYYLDLMWPASRHYAVDPLLGADATLSADRIQYVLGGEACMWTEYAGPENIDSRIWPRAAAVAERLWSPAEVRDAASMNQRLQEVSWRLERLGLTHNSSYVSMLRRIAGTSDISALRVLADVVEPVKDYTRMQSSAILADRWTPLNRLVDAVAPESAAGRQFTELVNAWTVAGRTDPNAEQQIRAYLTAWADHYQSLRPLASQSFLLKEIEPVSKDLSALGLAGLRALDLLARRERPPDSWVAQQLALVEEATKPRADLLLTVAPTVGKLIQASADQGGSTPIH